MKRIHMRKIRDVLRLKFDGKLSYRQINRSTQLSIGSIKKIVDKMAELGLSWPLPEGLSDEKLASLFYPQADVRVSKKYEPLDYSNIYRELKSKGMTLQLLWEEYCCRFPNRSYSYSQYCERYRSWLAKQKRSMRQTHKAGEKLFVDYAGNTLPIINPDTGECQMAQIFVAVLGASNYTFAEATYSQTKRDWLESHVRAFEFFGGVPEQVVPDNLKSAVNKACRYDPELNPSYQQLAEHYQVAIVPARPYKPKDKSKAEIGVQIVERWILAKLRNQQFFSLSDVNTAIKTLLADLNQKPFKKLPGNRQQWFEQLDQPALSSLPRYRYEFIDIKTTKVNIDYHIEYQSHFYSVPHQYVGEKLEVHAGSGTISCYYFGNLVACHLHKKARGTTTDNTHRPSEHQHQAQWNAKSLKYWAQSTGTEITQWMNKRLDGDFPEQGIRACIGLMGLAKTYGEYRLNQACLIANQQGLDKFSQIKSILKTNQDRLPEESCSEVQLPQDHENIRGAHNYS